jgi:hypothetical protein
MSSLIGKVAIVTASSWVLAIAHLLLMTIQLPTS